MKKPILFLIFIFLFSKNAVGADLEKTTFTCPDLTFTVSPVVNTVNFSNIRAFGVGEMISDIPIGMTLNKNSVMKAEYNWYYTTKIEIKFDQKLWQYEHNGVANIEFSFDDDDGIYLEAEPLKCVVKYDSAP